VAEDSSDKTTEPTSAEAPTQPTPATEAPTEPAGAPLSGWRQGVHVPAWALGLFALFLVGLLGFGIGRWTAPDNDGEVSGVFQGQVEEGEPQVEPNLPSPLPADRVVLGVAAEDSSDPDGAELVRVLGTGPAGEAGLEPGDVITAVGDDEVNSAEELAETVQAHEAGDDVTIDYERDGESDETDVTLVAVSDLRPAPGEGGERESSDAA
jgi:membrane-associated protease RseP (regulator of RpoE activity)